MLTVYTYPHNCPANALDLSVLPLDEMSTAVIDICRHQTTAYIWFGYLEGWMLTPQEEVILRRALRKFDCGLVTAFPFSLSHAWQNEIDTVYTEIPHGATDSDNNGCVV